MDDGLIDFDFEACDERGRHCPYYGPRHRCCDCGLRHPDAPPPPPTRAEVEALLRDVVELGETPIVDGAEGLERCRYCGCWIAKHADGCLGERARELLARAGSAKAK